jgi:hypothetical protein
MLLFVTVGLLSFSGCAPKKKLNLPKKDIKKDIVKKEKPKPKPTAKVSTPDCVVDPTPCVVEPAPCVVACPTPCDPCCN